ncbi:MAG: dipeptidyl-peptidase 3 family protein [Chthoniobacterales bacterium]
MKILPFTIVLFAATTAMAPAQNTGQPDQAKLERMTARFALTEITADVAKLSPNDRKVLAKLIEASQIIDGIFLRQSWAGNPAMLLNLAGDQSPEGRALLHYFILNKGPWSSLDRNAPFVLGAPLKPEGAGFYPLNSTKAEIESWIKSLPAAEQERAKGFFTVVRRKADKQLTLVPYNIEYEGELTRAGALLREAARLASETTLQRFLTTRAEAFMSNDYYQTDVAWMELKGAIEPTIGPYEVYEDGWFNYKAAFESFITVQDEAESAKLEKFSGQLQDIENHLPIDPKYRNPKLGALSPMVVANEIFCAGDGNHGVQTAAFNLPNDERVTREKGSKRVMLKNVQEAKFAKTLLPISKIVLSPNDQKDVSFDAFFTHIVVHELMHGLGPHDVIINGRKSTVRQELKDTYSALEEAKADISSLFAIQYMIDKGVLPKSLERPLYTTYLASSFRTIRFGGSEAHGRGMVVQLNYLLDHGAFIANPDGTFAVNMDKIKAGVEGLTHEIMTLQAEGNYEKAKDLLPHPGSIKPEMERALDRMGGLPVDIEPKFTTAEQLVRENP